MISSLFSKASSASIVAVIGWFALLVPFFSTENSSDSTKFLACVSSNSALLHGLRLIYQFEKHNGLQWSNVWEKPTISQFGASDNFSLGIVMTFLFGSSLFYLLIALYVEKILPGKYGVPMNWYLPFTKGFWFGVRLWFFFFGGTESDSYVSSDPNFESDYIGIKMRKLRKIYAHKKVAVNGLTLDVFNGEITVLLGTNGAGKTTIMSMLSGWIPPTSGTAILNGHDIRKKLQKARNSMGYCPQVYYFAHIHC